MSAAAATPAPDGTSAQSRPRPLPDRAWSLACQGHRSPAIAARLGVPERTVRAWLAATRRAVAAELAAERADELLRAVEHLRQISLAAWEAYDQSQQRDTAILAGQLDYLRSRRLLRAPSSLPSSLAQTTDAPLPRPSLPGKKAEGFDTPAETATTSPTVINPLDAPSVPEMTAHILAETYGRPPLSHQGPALLRLVLAAQRELIQLLDLPALARAQSAGTGTQITPADTTGTSESPETSADLLWWQRDPAQRDQPDPPAPAETAETAASPAHAAASWTAQAAESASTPERPTLATSSAYPADPAVASAPAPVSLPPQRSAIHPPARPNAMRHSPATHIPTEPRRHSRPTRPHTRAAARRPVLVAVPPRRSHTPASASTPAPTPRPPSSLSSSSATSAHPSASSTFPVFPPCSLAPN